MDFRTVGLPLGTLLLAALAGRQVPGTVVGIVRDEHSGAPLMGVTVHVAGRSDGSEPMTRTDSAGRYRLARVTAGLQTVDALRGFYFPEHRLLRVHAGAVDTLDFLLRPDSECCDREPAP
jgi:hypothetical protein